jgi:uncharacterized protein (TIGR00369 family)
MVDQLTHNKINPELSGQIIQLEENYSKVKLKTISEMIADEKGLIHGGFLFSLADFAAMVCINHPNVVLGGATVRFLKPVKQGDILIAEGKLSKVDGKKRIVSVTIKIRDQIVFKGDFQCFIPNKHVLEG